MPKSHPHTSGPWQARFIYRMVKAARETGGLMVTSDPSRDWADASLMAASPDYFDGIETMLANEQSGGDGWWKGFEMLKAAHAKAKGETD